MLTTKHYNTLSSTVSLCRNARLLQKLICNQSTNITVIKSENKQPPVKQEYPPLDTKFNQYEIGYRYRRADELLRGYLVYRLFSVDFFIKNQYKIASWGRQILGNHLFNTILKLTAFNHFVGGETTEEITPVIKRLQAYRVQPILDYSVESDLHGRSKSPNEIDRMHDENTQKFIECIQTSHEICGPNNLIAIKITALIRPNVLKNFNGLLKSMSDRSLLSSVFEFINQQSASKNIDTCLNESFNLPLKQNQKQIASNITLTPDDISEIQKLLQRLNQIAQACVKNNISIMVDAEQTYFQTAINYFGSELQRYYNKSNVPVVYGTYQCYLKETFDRLKNDLALSEKYNYVFAAKLVRGAYIDQEQRLAKEHGYENPINPSFEATTTMYHRCFDEALKAVVTRKMNQVRIMVASHNEDTVRYTIEKMKEHNISRVSSIISFASLYGMSDYISFALANSGYKTYKYLPYGPLDALQPYLFRRASENRGIFAKAQKDRRFHFKALKDRLFGSKD